MTRERDKIKIVVWDSIGNTLLGVRSKVMEGHTLADSLAEFPNVIWIQVHTDAGHVGLGETFFGSQAIHAYVHETLAPQMQIARSMGFAAGWSYASL